MQDAQRLALAQDGFVAAQTGLQPCNMTLRKRSMILRSPGVVLYLRRSILRQRKMDLQPYSQSVACAK